MPSQSVEITQFGGLRLLPDPQDVSVRGAISMLNAEINRDRTIVGSRAGLSRLGTGTATYHRATSFSATQLIAFRNTGSGLTGQLVTISSGAFGSAFTAYGSSSTIVTSAMGLTGAAGWCTRSGATNDAMRAWDGVAAAATANTYSPRYMAVSPVDSRAIVAHFTSAGGTPSGANGTTSTVYFANAGDVSFSAGSFPTNNFLNLFSWDGEEITGMVVWRDLIFVIKRSKVYVIYDTSATDGSGNAVFRFRQVNLPALARATQNRGGENIVAGPDGVYMLLADGIYRSTGGQPVLISRPIDPLFNGTGDSSMLFPSAASDWTIGSDGDRIYLSYSVSGNFRTLVYDTVLQEWLIWDITGGTAALPTGVFTWFDTNGSPVSYFAAGSKVFSLSSTATSDDGTAITSNYRLGFWNPGQPGTESWVREVLFDGTGSITVKQAANDASTLGSGQTVTLGTAPQVAQGRDRRGIRGRNLSLEMSATSAWTVSRVTPIIWGQSAAGKKAA